MLTHIDSRMAMPGAEVWQKPNTGPQRYIDSGARRTSKAWLASKLGAGPGKSEPQNLLVADLLLEDSTLHSVSSPGAELQGTRPPKGRWKAEVGQPKGAEHFFRDLKGPVI